MKKKKILDLGCGGGILSESLAEEGAELIAIDQSKKLINEAKKLDKQNMLADQIKLMQQQLKKI